MAHNGPPLRRSARIRTPLRSAEEAASTAVTVSAEMRTQHATERNKRSKAGKDKVELDIVDVTKKNMEKTDAEENLVEENGKQVAETGKGAQRKKRGRKGSSVGSEKKAEDGGNTAVEETAIEGKDVEGGEVQPVVKKKQRKGEVKSDPDLTADEVRRTKKREATVEEVVIDGEATKEAEKERAWGVVRDNNLLKIVTWNVTSCRTVAKSGALMDYIEREGPDVLCLQETKMTKEAVEEIPPVEGYDVYWNHSQKKGYSGVAVFMRKGLNEKVVMKKVKCGMGLEEADKEGRVIRVEFEGGLNIVNAYVPNSGGKLARLGFRTEVFEPAMRQFLDSIKNEGGKIVYSGDLNVAHEVIDIHNSKGNQKSAGHTPQERKQFSILLESGQGWADSFRRVYPGVRGYTYFSRRFGNKMKKENKGWRLDYHVIDEESFGKGVVKDIYVRKDVEGSDHYPLVLEYRLLKGL